MKSLFTVYVNGSFGIEAALDIAANSKSQALKYCQENIEDFAELEYWGEVEESKLDELVEVI